MFSVRMAGVLSKQLGHRNATVTEQRYIHLFDRTRTDESVRDAIEQAMGLGKDLASTPGNQREPRGVGKGESGFAARKRSRRFRLVPGCRPSTSWGSLVRAQYRPLTRGYGRDAVRLAADIVRANGATELLTSCVPAEDGPGPFYRRIGFTPTGELDENGEIILALRLDR